MQHSCGGSLRRGALGEGSKSSTVSFTFSLGEGGVRGGGRHAVGVGAELGAPGGVGPAGVGADVPPALGDGVLARIRLRDNQQQHAQRQQDPQRDHSHANGEGGRKQREKAETGESRRGCGHPAKTQWT